MKTKLITYLLFIAQCCAYAQTKTVVPPNIAAKWDVWIPGATFGATKDGDRFMTNGLPEIGKKKR